MDSPKQAASSHGGLSPDLYGDKIATVPLNEFGGYVSQIHLAFSKMLSDEQINAIPAIRIMFDRVDLREFDSGALYAGSPAPHVVMRLQEATSLERIVSENMERADPSFQGMPDYV